MAHRYFLFSHHDTMGGIVPAEDLAPCGFGAFGVCCCTCVNHLTLVDQCDHLGGTRKCGEFPEEEYVCLVFAAESNVTMKSPEHGMCEGHFERKPLPVANQISLKEELGKI